MNGELGSVNRQFRHRRPRETSGIEDDRDCRCDLKSVPAWLVDQRWMVDLEAIV